MVKVSKKLLALGGLFFVTIFFFLVAQKVTLLQQTQPVALPKQNKNYPIEERTVNVYTGNVVDSSAQKDTPQTFEKQKGRTYPISDGKTYRIIAGREYVCEERFWMDSHYVEILQVKINGKWQEVYRTKDEGDENCSRSLIIDDRGIVLSPLKDYVRFSIVGWEWSNTLLVNIKTKTNVIEKDIYPREFQWSNSAHNYTFISTSEVFGGTGVDGVWASEFNNPDKPLFIFDLQKWAGKDVVLWENFALKNLKFLNNRTIEFSIFRVDPMDSNKYLTEVAQYKYDLRKEKLTEVFRK